MEWLYELRPIRFFSFYLALIFFLSTWMRLRQYRAILSLITRLHTRWPQVTKLVLSHRHIFLTWENLRPLLLVLGLLIINTLASQFVWPHAQTFKVADLLVIWPALPIVIVTTTAMVVFDVYGVIRVGEIDRAEAEKYLDMAESWLSGWRARWCGCSRSATSIPGKWSIKKCASPWRGPRRCSTAPCGG